MKNKSFESFLYSVGGVLILLLILLAVNYLAGMLRARADLTHGGVYTLSEGTKKVLGALPAPIKLRYYASRSEQAMPVALKSYAKHVEDMLSEFKQFGKGKVIVEKFDPAPDSDAEDSAGLDGVEPQVLQSGERVYLGMAVSQLDRKTTLSFLSPERETLLEYDITRAITQVVKPEKPVVGLMSALPVFGSPGMPQMGQQGQPAWAFLDELRRDYNVRQLPLSAQHIDDDIKVLVVLHPRDIKDVAQYAIDQFVLRGGKLVAFVDPFAYFDQVRAPNNPMPMGGGQSNLDALLTNWGVTLEKEKVVADLRLMGRAGQQSTPTVLFLQGEDTLDAKDLIMSQVGTLVMPFAGTFTGKPAAGLTQTVLARSSTQGELKDAMQATQPVNQHAVAVGGTKAYPIAIKLSGKFKTAFPDGKPDVEKDPNADPGAPDQQAAQDKDRPHLKESAKDNTVVLIADADLLADQASVQVTQDLSGQRVLAPKNGNIALLQGFVDLFGGDENLISLRSRVGQFRPLSVVMDMQARAQKSYMGEIQRLEQSLGQTQQRINDLQKTKGEGQQFIVSPEQKAELEKFRKEQVDTRQRLKQLRKTLRAETDRLETRTKVLNIVAMPLLVALAGIGLAWLKRRRVAAR
jgi:ABC-type uncharacterized transport system involved in gliding motility auxiliary subunit